jgi:cell division protein FtsN
MPSRSPLDLISRIVMLVLAGMVTLSVIGVIEAIPRGAMQDRVGVDQPRQQIPQQPQPEPEPQPVEPQPDRAKPPRPEPSPGAVSAGAVYGPGVLPSAPTEDDDVDRWLEAITHALMALVGLVGIATLILWRSLRERRRIADALEALAAQRS